MRLQLGVLCFSSTSDFARENKPCGWRLRALATMRTGHSVKSSSAIVSGVDSLIL
jgi:hypothetical protein